MKRTAALLCAALSFAAQPAFGQVAIGGGAGVVFGGGAGVVFGGGAGVVFGGYGRYGYRGYGPHFYGGYAPYIIVEPWAMAPLVPHIPDALPSCYRYGRCSSADMAIYRYRTERLDRLAPTSPPDTAALDRPRPHAPPPPTAEQDIHPEFRGSSVVREEYRESGRPIDGRQ